MRKRKPEEVVVQSKPEEKVLDVNATMQGTLRFDDPVNLRISGRFEGKLDAKGVLMIGEKADIKADITGETISIAGVVNGNIKATKTLKLDASAKLNGDVETPRISISEGAFINGQLRMKGMNPSAGSASRGDWMTANQLAEYLEVESHKVNEWVNNGMLPGTRNGGEWMFERSKVDQWVADGKVKA